MFPLVPAKIHAKHLDMLLTSRVIYRPPPSKKICKCVVPYVAALFPIAVAQKVTI